MSWSHSCWTRHCAAWYIYTQTMHNNYVIYSKLKIEIKKCHIIIIIMLSQSNHMLENVCRHMLCTYCCDHGWVRFSPTQSCIRDTGVGREREGVHGGNDRWRCGRQWEGRGASIWYVELYIYINYYIYASECCGMVYVTCPQWNLCLNSECLVRMSHSHEHVCVHVCVCACV